MNFMKLAIFLPWLLSVIKKSHFLWGCSLAIFLGLNSLCSAAENRIRGVSIISETPNQLVVEVQYSYAGDHGQTAFASVVMADKGKPLRYFSYGPGRVNRGSGKTRVKLGVTSSAPPNFSSNQLLVKLYGKDGKSFQEGFFNFSKTWLKPGTSLQPAVHLIATVPAILPQVAVNTQGNKVIKMREIMPNGNVVLNFQDGIKKVLFKGGYEITTPQGQNKQYLFSTGQFPTPPSVPPDNSHAMWLLHENKLLLDIIKSLVNNHQDSINNYLNKEAEKNSYYEKIISRTQTINWLISQ